MKTKESNESQRLRPVENGRKRTIVFVLILATATMSLGLVPVLQGQSNAVLPGQRAASACNPDGNQFNLEAPANPPLRGQFDESVAFLPNRAANGDDLVFGVARDFRILPLPFGTKFEVTPTDAFYVQRSHSNCTADLEGLIPSVPLLGTFPVPFGSPAVAADPAHDAFFVADLRFTINSDITSVGVVKATAARLLNSKACPDGTEATPGVCFDAAALAESEPLNTLLFNPAIAVDQRSTGVGNGDVYVAVTLQNNAAKKIVPEIDIVACTNASLRCGQPTKVKVDVGTVDALPWVQVRPDGVVSLSWENVFSQNGREVVQMMFLTCTPNGAPLPLTCNTPVVAAQPRTPALGDAGDVPFVSSARPTHVHRLESDGKSVTTFLTYEQCDVLATTLPTETPGHDFCPKDDVVVIFSTDGGNTWSRPEKVSTSPGQQFHAAMALDTSTETVNIAYYSTENDLEKLRSQVFLAQILPGSTSANKPNRLTSNFYDAPQFGSFFTGYGDYLSLAAGGSGKAGQSKVYVHFAGTTKGIYNGRPFPSVTNILALFEY
jgi:hypothetical protein